MFISLLLLALGQTARPVVEAHKVFRGPEGQLIDVLTLSPRKDKKGLVRVRNADSDTDGLVMEVTLDDGDASTTYRGQPWHVLAKQRIFVPGKTEFIVAFDQAATEALVDPEVLSAWESQGPRRALFVRREWPALEKKYQAAADTVAAPLTKSCGHPVALTFDWSSFPDSVMGEIDVWKKCEPLLAAAKKSCPAKLTCRVSGSAYEWVP